MEGEVGVNRAKTRNEMVFESSNGFFSRVGAMDVGRNQLEVNSLRAQVVTDKGWTFIVKDMEFGREAAGFKKLMEGLDGLQLMQSGFRFQGACKDGIGIMAVKHHDIFVAVTGGEGKTASLISAHLAG